MPRIHAVNEDEVQNVSIFNIVRGHIMPRIHAVNEDEVQNNAECLIPYSILYEVTFIPIIIKNSIFTHKITE